MPAQRLKQFLDSQHVPYKVLYHKPAYTSCQTAWSAYESMKDFAKIVMVKIDGEMVMVVMPADHKIDFSYLRHELGVRNVDLASEEEFKTIFPDCEPGAMPPFGELYGVEVYIDDSFGDNEMISFNAGNHREMIKMRFADFLNVSKAKPISYLLVFTTT